MNRIFVCAFGFIVAASVMFSAGVHARPSDYTHFRVISAAYHDVSPRLRDTRWYLPAIVQRIVGDERSSKRQLQELIHRLQKAGILQPPGSHEALRLEGSSEGGALPAKVRDPVVQRQLAEDYAGGSISSVIGFDGLGSSTGLAIHSAPPDANIAVGMKYVVETVNTDFAVYKKKNGSLVMGPVDLRNLWSNFKGRCGGSIFSNSTYSEPQVVYDQLAQRWIISIGFGGSGPSNPSAYCVAVSRTNDPTGEYYRYQFDVFPKQLILRPENAKLGVWSDSYDAAFNLYKYPGNGFVGEGFIALDRAAMLHGLDAKIVEIEESALPVERAYSVLPVTVEGFTPPPKGEPGLFANYVSPSLIPGAPFALYLWEMHVNWTNPQNATVDGPEVVTVPPFNDLICGGVSRGCIPPRSAIDRTRA